MHNLPWKASFTRFTGRDKKQAVKYYWHNQLNALRPMINVWGETVSLVQTGNNKCLFISVKSEWQIWPKTKQEVDITWQHFKIFAIEYLEVNFPVILLLVREKSKSQIPLEAWRYGGCRHTWRHHRKGCQRRTWTCHSNMRLSQPPPPRWPDVRSQQFLLHSVPCHLWLCWKTIWKKG